eukprot:g3471.t1
MHVFERVIERLGGILSENAVQFALLKWLQEGDDVAMIEKELPESDFVAALSKLCGACIQMEEVDVLDKYDEAASAVRSALNIFAAKVDESVTLVESDDNTDEGSSFALSALSDEVRGFVARKLDNQLVLALNKAIISKDTEKLKLVSQRADRGDVAVVASIFLKNLYGNGVGSFSEVDATEFAAAEAALSTAESKLAAAMARADRLETENQQRHESLIAERKEARKMRAQIDALEDMQKRRGEGASSTATQSPSTKLEVDSAKRLVNSIEAENLSLKKRERELRAELQGLEEKMLQMKTLHDSEGKKGNRAAIRRLQRDLNNERTERRNAEKQLAWALKQQDQHNRHSATVENTRLEAKSLKITAEAQMNEAERLSSTAEENSKSAKSRVLEAEERAARLEALLVQRDSELAEMASRAESMGDEIRAESRREVLKQKAELERVKTMMDWKAKIVEDDVRFRTESEWRGRAKVLVKEVEDLRMELENSRIEKSSIEIALTDALAKVDHQQQAIDSLNGKIAELLEQQRAVDHIKGTVDRLRVAAENQWRGAAARDNATVHHLQKELDFFRNRRQVLPTLNAGAESGAISNSPVMGRSAEKHEQTRKTRQGKVAGRTSGGYAKIHQLKHR